MLRRDGGRIRTAIRAWTGRPMAARFDVEQGAADDAALPQRTGPVERGGGGDADRGGQIPVGPPSIMLQFPQQRRI